MGILTDVNTECSSISSDVSVGKMINSLGVNYLSGKAIEAIVEKGVASNDMTSSQSILNAIYYLVADLEENHSGVSNDWQDSEIMTYIKNIE